METKIARLFCLLYPLVTLTRCERLFRLADVELHEILKLKLQIRKVILECRMNTLERLSPYGVLGKVGNIKQLNHKVHMFAAKTAV